MKRPKGESSFRFDTEVHILQQAFTEIPTKSEVKTIMWKEPQEMGYSFFVFRLQDKKSLATVSGVLPLRFFSGHKEHSPFPLFQKSFLMGVKRTKNNWQDLRADIVLCWVAMLGLEFTVQHSISFSKNISVPLALDGRSSFIPWCAQLIFSLRCPSNFGQSNSFWLAESKVACGWNHK